MTTGQLVLSLITAVAAFTAAGLSWWSGRHLRREEWWRRFQWATEQAVDPDPAHAAVGISVLDALTDSRLAGKDEFLALDAVLTAIIDPEATGHLGGGDPDAAA